MVYQEIEGRIGIEEIFHHHRLPIRIRAMNKEVFLGMLVIHRSPERMLLRRLIHMIQRVRFQAIHRGSQGCYLLGGQHLPDDQKALPVKLVRFGFIQVGLLLTI